MIKTSSGNHELLKKMNYSTENSSLQANSFQQQIYNTNKSLQSNYIKFNSKYFLFLLYIYIKLLINYILNKYNNNSNN